MPKLGPLSPIEAKRTLANRFAGSKDRVGIADRLRQLNTRFGLRAKRVFLVWTKWTGEQRGEGEERELARVELLPTPRISDLTGVVRNPYAAGFLPVGTVRVDQISAGRYTQDELRGLRVPGLPGENPRIPETVSFFYEVQEDGRDNEIPGIESSNLRQRYRIYGGPNRHEGNVYQSVVLERMSEDRSRRGRSQVGPDADDTEEALRQGVIEELLTR